jgi:hypothetical protein
MAVPSTRSGRPSAGAPGSLPGPGGCMALLSVEVKCYLCIQLTLYRNTSDQIVDLECILEVGDIECVVNLSRRTACHQPQQTRSERAMAASGAPALVAALRDGGAAAALAARQCQALCITSSGRAALSRCGAVAATVGLIDSTSSGDADVSRPACHLLNQLCSECPPNAAAALAAGCMRSLARLCGGEDPLAALEAYAALLAVVTAEGLHAASAHFKAAAAAGAADAAARLVARPRGGAGDVCLGEALSVLNYS